MNLISLIENGIAVVHAPFQELAKESGTTEQAMIEKIKQLKDQGIMRRFGVVVKHHELGYRKNAMVVWSIPPAEVEFYGLKLKQFEFVTLCYQRRTVSDIWPYNLYCMIHAKTREEVQDRLKIINQQLDISKFKNNILISERCFKQKGARYSESPSDWKTKLLNRLQIGLAPVARPFQNIAQEIGVHESEVMAQIKIWLKDGTLTRFGPMYNVEKMGGEFTLVAMEVPSEHFEEVNQLVNAHTEVAHNYERDHRLNMWFVVACDNLTQTEVALRKIESETGLRCYAMPKEKEYFLNLQLEVK